MSTSMGKLFFKPQNKGIRFSLNPSTKTKKPDYNIQHNFPRKIEIIYCTSDIASNTHPAQVRYFTYQRV